MMFDSSMHEPAAHQKCLHALELLRIVDASISSCSTHTTAAAAGFLQKHKTHALQLQLAQQPQQQLATDSRYTPHHKALHTTN